MKRIEEGFAMDKFKIWVCTGIINKKINGVIKKDKQGNNIKVTCKHRKSWHHVEPNQAVV